MRHHITTEIHIDAPPQVVWQVLTDLSAYSEWNPFITSATGSPQVGEKLVNRMCPPGGRPITFKPVVTVADEARVLEWLGTLGMPGVFDGRHRFEIEPGSTGTTFTQSEQFDGVLVRMMRTSLDNGTWAGFEATNTALKARAEARL